MSPREVVKKCLYFVRPLGLGHVNETLQSNCHLEEDYICIIAAAGASCAAQGAMVVKV
jgi:hypothetical protein